MRVYDIAIIALFILSLSNFGIYMYSTQDKEYNKSKFSPITGTIAVFMLIISFLLMLTSFKFFGTEIIIKVINEESSYP
jgi:hypothetical protein